MANRSSSALDYSVLNTAARPLRKPSPTPRRKNNVIRMPRLAEPATFFGRALSTKTVIQALLACVLVVGVVVTVVVNKVKINELSRDLQEEQTLLSEAEQKQSQLEMEAQAKINIRDVEEYATNELGMQLPERYQMEFITQPEGDKTVIAGGQPDENGRNIVKDWNEIALAATNILAYLD